MNCGKDCVFGGELDMRTRLIDVVFIFLAWINILAKIYNGSFNCRIYLTVGMHLA